jgi:thioredoxin reductase
MTRTVDVVIVCGDAASVAAVIDASRRGKRVLVVIPPRRASLARHLRQSLLAAGVLSPRLVTIVTGSEVACVDGVNGIEAVVVRHVRTGRLTGFNASALLFSRGLAKRA